MDVYLPAPVTNRFGSFPAGKNTGLTEPAAAALVLYGGGQVADGPQDFVALSRDEYAAFKGVVSGAVIPPAMVTRIHKPIGQSVTLGSQVAQTLQIKAAVPADVDALGLAFFHHDTSNALTGVRACVAATETFYEHGQGVDATDIANRKWHPYANRTGYRVLDDATSLYGWRSALWGGAVSPTLAQPTIAHAPSIGLMDLLSLPDLPPHAADIAAGGSTKYRYVMARVYVPGAAGNKYGFSAFAPSNAATAINGGMVTRFAQSGGDIVTTSINSSPGDFTQWLPVALTYRTRSRARSAMFVGDSLTQGQGSVSTSEGMVPWCVRACTRARGYSAGFAAINLGCASQTQATYLAAVQAALPVLKPHLACFQVGSPNDGPFATVLAAQQYFLAAMQRVYAFLDLCDQYRVLPVLMTMIPCAPAIIASSGTGLLIDAERIAHNTRVRALCAAGGAVLFDADARLTDAGNVDAAGVRRIKAAVNGDDTHYNDAGSEVLADAFVADVLSRY